MVDFPLWVRLSHFFNFLFLILLIRSGMGIIGAHPKLYWNDDANPGDEWARFTDKELPDEELWTAEDESEPYSKWIALPGLDNLGLARHWHFWPAALWTLTGVIYVVLLFTSGRWHELVPTSWAIIPGAWDAFVTYLQFEIPESEGLYHPLQQLSYFFVIFILSPIQIATGIAMSPALEARFPWFQKLFGGHQGARSLHFVGTVIFVLFTVVHVALVGIHGFGPHLTAIVLGSADQSHALGVGIAVFAIAAVLAANFFASEYTLRNPVRTKKLLRIGIAPLRKRLFHHWEAVADYDEDRISPFSRPNGRPPRNETYEQLKAGEFEDWELEVGGLVENERTFSMDELREMPTQEHTSKHICIQGWTYYAKWSGVSISEIIERCNPKPEANYLVFHTLDEKWEYPDIEKGNYYQVLDTEEAMEDQTMLAYGMNNGELPEPHGAPLRLRIESHLGYRMAKWVCGIEFVEDYEEIGDGQDGWRDDVLHYYPVSGGI